MFIGFVWESLFISLLFFSLRLRGVCAVFHAFASNKQISYATVLRVNSKNYLLKQFTSAYAFCQFLIHLWMNEMSKLLINHCFDVKVEKKIHIYDFKVCITAQNNTFWCHQCQFLTAFHRLKKWKITLLLSVKNIQKKWVTRSNALSILFCCQY